MQILRKNGCLKPITWKELENGCWECTSHGKVGRGYAQIKPYGEKRTLVTRYLYEQLFGEIPDGMVVMHKCDNPKCINPEHLKLGTYADNVEDMKVKNRGKNHKGYNVLPNGGHI